MVNLLPRRSSPGEEEVRFEAEQGHRIAARLAPLEALVGHARQAALERSLELLASELEELASAPHRVAALALLEAVDALRIEAARGLPDAIRGRRDEPRGAGSGAFVCHRPGRSLATGEAEIASRGYFDVEDRPPLASWLGLLPLAPPVGEGEADFVIVAWVAPEDRERARAGCRACASGAVAWLDDVAPAAAGRLADCVATAFD